MDELFEWECKNSDLFTTSPDVVTNKGNETQNEDSMYLLWLGQLNQTTFGKGVKLTENEAIEVIRAKKIILSFLSNPTNPYLLINKSKIGAKTSTLIEAIFNGISQAESSSEEEKIEQILTCVLYVNSFGLSKEQLGELLNSLRLKEWLESDSSPQINTDDNEVDYLKLSNEMASSHFREYIQLKQTELHNDIYVNQTVLPKLFKGDVILNEVIHQLLNELKYVNLLNRVKCFVKNTINCDQDFTQDLDLQLHCYHVSLDQINVLAIQKIALSILLPSRLISEQISPLSLLDFYLDCYHSNQELADKKSVYDTVHFVDYKTFTTMDQFRQEAKLQLQNLDLHNISQRFRFIFTQLLLFNLNMLAGTQFHLFKVITLKEWDPFNVENQIIFIKGNFYAIHKHMLYHSTDILRLIATTRQEIL